MSDHPELSPDEPEPIRGEVRYSQVSARVPEEIGDGCFASAVMVMTGPFEHVLDFVQRLSEAPRVVARIVLPSMVARQFAQALRQNIANFEGNFGPLPKPPPLQQSPPHQQPTSPMENAPPEDAPDEQMVAPPFNMGFGGGPEDEPPQWTTHPPDSEPIEPALSPPAPPNIEQIYDDLRLPDAQLSGSYANAVLIRHSSTEFCFDFITNIFPRSAVSARVYLASPNVGPLLQSLERSFETRP